MDLPIVCTLSESELQERRRNILDRIRELVLEVTPLESGFAYRFEPASEILSRLSNLVDLERQCCGFLSFRIIVEPRQPVVLEVTGPRESRSLIADFWGSE